MTRAGGAAPHAGAARAVAAVVDPITRARIGGDVEAALDHAFRAATHGWADGWWQHVGAQCVNDAAVLAGIEEAAAVWFTAAAAHAVILTRTPLAERPVVDLAVAAARWDQAGAGARGRRAEPRRSKPDGPAPNRM